MLDGYMYVEIMRGLVGAFVDFSWDREGWIIPHTQAGRQAGSISRARAYCSFSLWIGLHFVQIYTPCFFLYESLRNWRSLAPFFSIPVIIGNRAHCYYSMYIQ